MFLSKTSVSLSTSRIDLLDYYLISQLPLVASHWLWFNVPEFYQRDIYCVVKYDLMAKSCDCIDTLQKQLIIITSPNDFNAPNI